MGIAQVREYFAQNNIQEEIKEFTISSATVELAAKAVGVEEQRIAKTLSFDVNGVPVLVVLAGDARIDNKKYKDCFGTKAKMLAAEEALNITGHPVGGVCPFALKTPLDVYLDVSLQRFSTVYPAAGSASSCVVITPQRLQEVANARWVDVCKLSE